MAEELHLTSGNITIPKRHKKRNIKHFKDIKLREDEEEYGLEEVYEDFYK